MSIRRIAFFIGAVAAVLAVVALTFKFKSNEGSHEALPSHVVPHEVLPHCPAPCRLESLFQHVR